MAPTSTPYVTPEQLQYWYRLHETATPGPWTPGISHDLGIGTFPSLLHQAWDTASGGLYSGYTVADSQFISAAREAIPRLIAEVERLQRLSLSATSTSPCSAE